MRLKYFLSFFLQAGVSNTEVYFVRTVPNIFVNPDNIALISLLLLISTGTTLATSLPSFITPTDFDLVSTSSNISNHLFLASVAVKIMFMYIVYTIMSGVSRRS